MIRTMKLYPIFILSLLTLLGMSVPAWAQADNSERGIVKNYETGKIAGIQVTVVLVNQNSFIRVAPDREFKPGEEIKVALESNFTGYAYLVNFGASGRNTVIFPAYGEANLLRAGGLEYLPKTYSIKFDENAGVEILRVFVSPQRIPFFETAIEARGGELNREDMAAISRHWRDSDKDRIGLVTNQAKVQTDKGGGTREPIWNEPKKRSLVTGRGPKKGRSKLAPGEVLVFGVNFKNAGGAK